MNKHQPLVTKRMEAVNENMVMDTCSEPKCGVTIWVDKDLKAQGRKSRCTSCLIREKIARGELNK